MADKDKKEILEDQEIKRTRITFSGATLQSIQQVTNSLVGNAKNSGVKIRGPVRLPNKHLRICCRRTPCG
jgi:small subunit ribosomal protein S20e